jgi:hypothetical protein
MHGSGENEASEEIPGKEKIRSHEGSATIRAVERLAPF